MLTHVGNNTSKPIECWLFPSWKLRHFGQSNDAVCHGEKVLKLLHSNCDIWHQSNSTMCHCQISNAPKGSLRGHAWSHYSSWNDKQDEGGSVWRHLATHDAPRPWQSGTMVGRVGFDDGQQLVVLTIFGGAWQWWLVGWLLGCGLGGYV